MIELEPVKIFSGDGKLYDRICGPDDYVRIGSILYREVGIEALPDPIEDIPLLTDTISNE